MNREIESHLSLLQEKFESHGMTASEARAAAIRSLGGVERTRELHREARSFVWLEQTWQDVRYGCRGLARTPGFTVVAVLTLALGIGLNTTVFSLFNAVALKPLPVADASHLFRLERWFQSGGLGTDQYSFTDAEFAYCRDHGSSFSSVIASSTLFPARGESRMGKMMGQAVSANYFADLGIPVAPGEGLVISDGFWRRAFYADPQIAGRTMEVNGTSYTIRGVAPKAFTGTSVVPAVPDFRMPLSAASALPLQMFVRLKPGVTTAAAQAEATLLIRQLAVSRPPDDPTTRVSLQHPTYFPNTDDIRFRALSAGFMLLVGLVLFVACANVGNMLLARGVARQRETAARMALGASRWRLIRQLLTEGVLLAVPGGAAGLLASVWSTRALGTFIAANALGGSVDIGAMDLRPDMTALAFASLISLGCGLLFSLSPAFQCVRRDITRGLKDSMSGMAGARMRGFLIGGQVAISVLLLAMAGLLTRGLMRSEGAEPGFDTRQVFVVSSDSGEFSRERQIALGERLRRRPEFSAVAMGSTPFAGTWTTSAKPESSQRTTRCLASYASDTYPDVTGIALLRGRKFTRQETSGSAPSAMVSESTARLFWPSTNALGRTLSLVIDRKGTWKRFEVVGVVKDVRFANVTRDDPTHVYLAGAGDYPAVLVRIGADRRAADSAADKEGATLVNLDHDYVAPQRNLSRALAAMSGTLAMLALVLAGAGIYGVIAYTVSRRTKEIGLRMALGATRWAVLAGIVLKGLRPVFVGMGTGMVVAGLLSSLLHRTLLFPGSMDFLYGVPFYDPATFAGLTAFVLLVALVACIGPGRRSVRVNPMLALRCD